MAAAHDPLESLWTPQALVAVVLAGEALALVLAIAPGGIGDRWVWFGLASLLIQWVLLATLGTLWLLRRPLSRLPPQRLAWACLVLLLASTLAVSVLGNGLLAGAGAADAATSSWFVPRMLAIALVMGLAGLAAFQNYADAKRLALRAKQAELEALQARIHPHFLFNTLNSAAALVHARPDDAERVLLDLGDLFRAALSEPGWVALAHELDLCRRYLAIEQLRYGDRLHVEWDLAHDQAGLSVPLLSVQPLVENAVTHGLDEATGRKALRIRVTHDDGTLRVTVDNAVPRSPPPVARRGYSIGLAGVRARIASATQGRGRLDAGIEGTRVTACLSVPAAAMPAPRPDAERH